MAEVLIVTAVGIACMFGILFLYGWDLGEKTEVVESKTSAIIARTWADDYVDAKIAGEVMVAERIYETGKSRVEIEAALQCELDGHDMNSVQLRSGGGVVMQELKCCMRCGYRPEAKVTLSDAVPTNPQAGDLWMFEK